MDKRWLIALVGLLGLLIIGWFLFQGAGMHNDLSASASHNKVKDHLEGSRQVLLSAEDSIVNNGLEDDRLESDQLASTATYEESEVKDESSCSDKIVAFMNTPEGERLKRWKQEVGAPYSEVLPDGTLYYPPHPYANYDNSSLQAMAESGDVNAMYAYGMNMYWKTFTGKANSSALQQGYAFPETSNTVDEAAFAEAEYWLYEAAVRGRLFAFHELAFMNSIRAQILKESGNLSEQEERASEAKAFVLGNAPEELIQGFSKNHFTMDSMPKELQEKLLANQMIDFIDDYQKDRTSLGLEPLVMEVPPEYDLSKNLCR